MEIPTINIEDSDIVTKNTPKFRNPQISIVTHPGKPKTGKTKEPFFQCKVKTCTVSTERKWDMSRHVMTCHDGLPIPCPDCNKVFKRKDNLYRHIRLHHPKAPTREQGTQTQCKIEGVPIWEKNPTDKIITAMTYNPIIGKKRPPHPLLNTNVLKAVKRLKEEAKKEENFIPSNSLKEKKLHKVLDDDSLLSHPQPLLHMPTLEDMMAAGPSTSKGPTIIPLEPQEATQPEADPLALLEKVKQDTFKGMDALTEDEIDLMIININNPDY